MNEENFASPLPSRPVNNVSNDEYVVNPASVVAPEIVERKKNERQEIEKVIGEVKKEKKINKFLVVGAILLILLSILGGVFLVARLNNKAVEADKTVILNYWGLWEDPSIMSGVIADFEAKNKGIRINYKRNQISDYRTRLLGRLAKTGTTSSDEVPDIFRIHNTWVSMFNQELADVPTDVIIRTKLEEDFYNVYKNDLKVLGKYKAIPLMYDGLVMLSNKDLLDKAGVKAPSSWWGMEAVFEKLTTKDSQGRVTQPAAALGLADNIDHWSDVLGLLIKQNGSNPTRTDDISNMKLQDVIKYYTLLAQKSGWNADMPNSTMAFAAGKTAFYFGPTWRIFNIMELNPSLNFDVNRVPQLPTILDGAIKGDITDPSKLTNIEWGSYWVEGVNAKSKYQKEAWLFLEYLSSNEALQKMYSTASQSRAFGEIYPRRSMAPLIETNPKIKPVLQGIDVATNWYLCSYTSDAGVNDGMIKYFGDAINAITQKGDTVEQAFIPLRNGITQLIGKYQITR